MNKYPYNPYCTRPMDSPMRPWCRCLRCRQYEEEQEQLDNNKNKESNNGKTNHGVW